MALVSMKEMLQKARKERYGIGALIFLILKAWKLY